MLADISRKLYTVNPSGGSPFEAAILLTLELERWKEVAALLMDRWRSQIQQLAYSHAIIYITRLFLLNDCKDIPQSSVDTYVHKCIGAAEEVMTIINGLASRKALIHGFWFTHYVCFCAITVVYIHIIKQHQASGDPSRKVENSSQLQYLFSLAETCQQHLGKATCRSSPNRRYGIILEQLRLQVHRQVVSSLRPGVQMETEENSHKSLSKADSFLPPSFHPAPVTAVSPKPNMAFDALPADLFASPLVDDSFKLYDSFGFPDSSDTSAWWAQLDSWVSLVITFVVSSKLTCFRRTLIFPRNRPSSGFRAYYGLVLDFVSIA